MALPYGCVSKTLSEERPYHEGRNSKSAVRQKGHKIMKQTQKGHISLTWAPAVWSCCSGMGLKFPLNCTGVEDALDVTMA